MSESELVAESGGGGVAAGSRWNRGGRPGTVTMSSSIPLSSTLSTTWASYESGCAPQVDPVSAQAVATTSNAKQGLNVGLIGISLGSAAHGQYSVGMASVSEHGARLGQGDKAARDRPSPRGYHPRGAPG